MSKYFIFLIILATSYARVTTKADTQTSAKPEVKEDPRFAAPLSEQDSARTQIFPLKQHPFLNLQNHYPQKWYGYPGYQSGLFSHPGGFLSYLHNKFQKPSFFRPPGVVSPVHPVRPVRPIHPVHPVHPVHHFPQKPIRPIITVPSVPVYTEPVYTKPSVPYVPFYPPIVPEQPVYPHKPSGPVITKPTYVVSEQVIHKPVLAETIEVVRRPVVTEFVEKVHKPVIQEELQVIKIPTFIEHVVKKPHVTKPVSSELVGEPIYLPSQHFTIHEKPLPLRPVTTQVYQIPHQTVASHGSVGYGSTGYDVAFSPVKPASNSFGSSYGGVSTSYGTPSYGFGSSYGGLGLGYGLGPGYGFGTSYPSPSYNFGSSYGGVGTSYAVPSYNFGSSYGGVGSSYGTPVGYNVGSGYGGGYNYGFGGPGYGYSPIGGIGASSVGYGGESEGVAHTFVEPAPNCKQSGGCKPSKDEELDDEKELPSYWPQMWYNGAAPQYDIQAKANDEYEMGEVYPYYFPFNQLADDVQIAKVREFLEDPSTRAQLMSMLQNYLEKNETPSQNLDEGKAQTGRSSNEDTSEADSTVEVVEDETVKVFLDKVKSLSPSMLKKFEDGLRDLRTEVDKNKSSNTDVPTKSTESTSTLSTAQST